MQHSCSIILVDVSESMNKNTVLVISELDYLVLGYAGGIKWESICTGIGQETYTELPNFLKCQDRTGMSQNKHTLSSIFMLHSRFGVCSKNETCSISRCRTRNRSLFSNTLNELPNKYYPKTTIFQRKCILWVVSYSSTLKTKIFRSPVFLQHSFGRLRCSAQYSWFVRTVADTGSPALEPVKWAH